MEDVQILVIDRGKDYPDELLQILEELEIDFKLVKPDLKRVKECLVSGLYDLVLLPILLPGKLNGLELGLELIVFGVPIIFFSEKEDEKIFQQARTISSAGYLVSPLKKYTLQSVVEAALMQRGFSGSVLSVFRRWEEESALANQLFVKTHDKLVKIEVSDIHYVEADGNSSYLHLQNQRLSAKKGLKQFGKELSPRVFVRIHRYYLVNIFKIESIGLQDGDVVVAGKSLPIGGAYRKDFIRKIDKMRT